MAKAKSSGARRSKLTGSTFAVPQSVVLATYVCTHDMPGCTKYIEGMEYEVLVSDPPPSILVVTNQGACNGTVLTLLE